MERVLAAFVRALRAAGSPVSTSETIDAVKAVGFIGYGNRQVLKHSLAAVLAKSETEKSTFDALFELYFNRETPPPGKAAQEDEAGEGGDDGEEMDLDVDALMQLAGRGAEGAAYAIEQAAAAA